jgi:ATP phosphoribosyltransferase
MTSVPLRLGLPKGRLLEQARPLLQAAGLDLSSLDQQARRLVHPVELPEIGPAEILLLRPSDVAVYVAHGVCAIGIVGSDVLAEQHPDVLAPLDLKIGRCRICLCAAVDSDPYRQETPRIATKYPRIATEHFLSLGAPAEIVELSGNVEIAPLVGLADGIVDIVETGETLAKNGLVIKAVLEQVSARLIFNRAAAKLRPGPLSALEERLRRAVAEVTP